MSKGQIFISLYLIITIFFGIKSYLRGEILSSSFMKINEYYFLEGDIDHNIVQLCEINNSSKCFHIKKISVQYKNYLIGETEDKKYFYINTVNNKEKKFNITKEELKQKFSKINNFILVQKYMNKYGTGNSNVLDIIIINSIIKALFLTPVILGLILFKIYPKSWNKTI